MNQNSFLKKWLEEHTLYIKVGFTLLSFVLLKVIFKGVNDNIILSMTLVAVAIIVAIKSPVANHDIPKANLVLIKGLSILFAFYIFVGAWQIPEDLVPSYIPNTLIIVNVIAVALFITSIFRSAFLPAAFLLMLTHKEITSAAYGMSISSTDYMPLVEAGMLLGLASIWSKHFPRGSNNGVREDTSKETHTFHLSILFVVIAVHFANYFYSAIQKLIISEPFWHWALKNPTYYLTAAAYQAGSLPLTILGEQLSQQIYSLLVVTTPIINILTILIQLAPILMLRSTKLIIWSRLLFDLTHVVIFLVTGIFFYKWIILNLLLVGAMYHLKSHTYNFKQYASLVGIMLLAPGVFFVAFLGWHDTPSYNDEYFIAHTQEQNFRIPSNYFLPASVTFAQGRIARDKRSHFPTGALGVLYKVSNRHPAHAIVQKCSSNLPSPATRVSSPRVTRIIRSHHKFILSNVNGDGLYQYDLYPHHIWSMPWEYNEFRNIDKRLITGYTHVIESKCLSSETLNGARLLNRSEVYIELE